MADNMTGGSASWWQLGAERLMNIGLDALRVAVTTGKPAATNTGTNTQSASSNFTRYLPYVAFGLAAVGIVVILAKR